MRRAWLPIIFVLFSSTFGLTRWSAVKMVPDADLLKGGEFVVDAHGFLFSDSALGTLVRPTAIAHLGIIEWVNLHVGYADGLTLGFKARILGETHPMMPSLAIGARNIVAHREVNYYHHTDTLADGVANEFFLAAGKSLESMKLRLHAGIQTIPTKEKELFNPYFAIEKYFGIGLYTTLEFHRRHEEYVPSLFVSGRFLKKRLEVSAGIVGISQMLFDEKGDFGLSLRSRATDSSFVRPGIWFGVRFLGNLGFGTAPGFSTLEQQVARQGSQLQNMQVELDSIRNLLDVSKSDLSKMGTSLSDLTNDNPTEKERIKSAILDRVIKLKSLYSTDPFEPEQVNAIIKEVVSYRGRAVPALKELMLDKSEEAFVRMTSAMLLGEVRSKDASDALLSILGSEEDPQIKIEALIALGKIRETKALYLIEQLAHDPNDAVALTAREVLEQIQTATGIRLKRDENAPENLHTEPIPASNSEPEL